MPKIYSGDLTKMFDISGKKAVIIGGAGGFGKAIAEGYAANGCDVLISSRRESALQEAKAEIEKVAAPGVKVTYFAGDAGDVETVKKMLDFTVGPDGLGGCDILVNAQGINQKMFSWDAQPQQGLWQDHQLRFRPRHPCCCQRRYGQRPLQHHQGCCRDADQGLRC